MDILKYIKEPLPVSEKWKRVRLDMATHIYGRPPAHIFKTRRPSESAKPHALDFRIDNFEPFTVEPVNLAINSSIEHAEQIEVDFKNIDDSTKDYVKDFKIRIGCKNYSLEEYIFKFLSVKSHADPNGIALSIPLHPTKDLTPSFQEEIPQFNDALTLKPRIEQKFYGSDKIHYIDDGQVLVMAGFWVYAIEADTAKSLPYFWHVSKDSTNLIYPDSESEYVEYEWYINKAENPPFHIVGGKLKQDIINNKQVTVTGTVSYSDDIQYYESDFYGAIAFLNLAIGIHSDLQIVENRFTHPVKVIIPQNCDNGCFPDENRVYKCDDDTTCVKCSGTGKFMDTSPLGDFIAHEGSYDGNGDFIDPVKFITPPSKAPDQLAKRFDSYFSLGKQSLYILDQNMTAQSGVSKDKDLRQKITLVTSIVNNYYRIYECILNDIQGILGGEQDIKIVMPPDYNLKSSEDITTELNSNVPSAYKSELTKKLILKRFGNTPINSKIVDFLSIYDLLFSYDTTEIRDKAIIFGNDFKIKDVITHDKGYSILQQIAFENENFLTLSDEELKKIFEDRISMLLPEEEQNTSGLRVASGDIETPVGVEAEAKAKLKGTVGGVQGIISINQAVADGSMSEKSAEKLLVEIYGFTEEVAKELIEPTGKPIGDVLDGIS